MVLGVSWLSTLGDIKLNWCNLSLSLFYNNQLISLTSPPPLQRCPVSLQSNLKTSDVWDYFELSMDDNPHPHLSPALLQQLNALIQKFQVVFQDAATLPPTRSSDHAIPVKLGPSIQLVRF